MIDQLKNWKWQVPEDSRTITTIEMHTGGEPLRVITAGLPPIKGHTVLEKRRYFREHYDHLRTGLMWEPRGHADMYGAVITSSLDADFDVFFIHNEGYSTMCGHAIIALTKLVIESGLIPNRDGNPEVVFNAPAGKVIARAVIEDGKVRETSFRNVPSFLYLRDQTVDVSSIGLVRFDIAFGGAFYAFVDSDALGLKLSTDDYQKLIDYGRRIKHAVMTRFPIQHPLEKELSFLYGTIFIGPAQNAAHHSRNVCVFADGEVDRSATGTGVSARAALHYAKGELPLNHKITIESIIGSTMTVRAAEETTFGPHKAIIPEVSGTGFITGHSEFHLDGEDPFVSGFLLR